MTEALDSFAWDESACISRSEALAATQVLAERLPCAPFYLNLCRNRYYFTIAFEAICRKPATNLLPINRAAGALAALQCTYPIRFKVDDAWVTQQLARAPLPTAARTSDIPADIPASHLAAIVFTSGSTGEPSAHKKHWGDLERNVDLFCKHILAGIERPNVVATVPPQHMYGLETSVLPCLHNKLAAHACCPLTPWDIAKSLERIASPRVLITTPFHLEACLKAEVRLPRLELVVSATAPLSAGAAETVETTWNTQLREIYGCSEVGSLACRETSKTEVWTLYDGKRLSASTPHEVSGAQIPQAFKLPDRIQVLDDGRFVLLGRAGDMLKVAGKRMSQQELTGYLLAIDGVEDAAVFVPDGSDSGRPAALVVAPERSKQSIVERLRNRVDPVFVPRPLVQVAQIPRNAMGKTPRLSLEACLNRACHAPVDE